MESSADGLSETETEGTCEMIEPEPCADGATCSDGFACDDTAMTCFDSCEAGDDHCAEGFSCDAGACVATAMTYPYVALISETTNADDINDTNTPGPDIDAIELTSGGTSVFATTIEASAQGAGGDADSRNANGVIATITGPNDAIPDGGGDCNLAEDDASQFWSMGDTTGFAVVSFGQDLLDGDTVTVWELDNVICNFSTERTDAYGAYVGSSAAELSEATTATDIGGDAWLALGSSAAGGMETFTFAMPTP